MIRSLRVGLLAALLLVLLAGCGEEAASEEDVLISLTDEVILPGYRTAASEVDELRQALESLCAAPSDSALAEAQAGLARGARGLVAYRGLGIRAADGSTIAAADRLVSRSSPSASRRCWWSGLRRPMTTFGMCSRRRSGVSGPSSICCSATRRSCGCRISRRRGADT